MYLYSHNVSLKHRHWLGKDYGIFGDVSYFKLQDGFLVVKYSAPLFADDAVSFPIAPISDTEAIFLGLGRGMGETIRGITINGQEHLQYSGYQLRKISTK
jgi:hypothetical protein